MCFLIIAAILSKLKWIAKGVIINCGFIIITEVTTKAV